jgi:glutathione S-transferase
MTMEIFWGSGSPFAWRALLALEVKRAAYTSRLLEFSKEQHKAPDYLALNPRGKVPTLKDGTVVVAESMAILAYLDRKLPEPPLFGRSAAETGRIWQAISECTSYLEPPLGRVLRPILFGQVAEKMDDIRAAAEDVYAELANVERGLGGRHWLATDALSAADIAVYPFVELLVRAAGKDSAKAVGLRILPLEKTYPAIAAWRERIRALPGYERTYPPHWREAGPSPAAAAE